MKLNKAFAYHQPGAAAGEKLTTLRQAYSDLANLVEALGPEPGRHRSLALTALEESAMWANKMVSHNDAEGQQLP